MRSRVVPDDAFRFLASAGVALLLQAALWIVVHDPAGVAFRAVGNFLISAAGVHGRVELTPAPPNPRSILRWGEATADTLARSFDERGAVITTLPISSLKLGYVPFGVLLSLMFASGVVRRRIRLRATFVVLAGVTAFVVLSTALTVLRYSSHPPRPLMVELGYSILVNPPGFEYVVPTFIWLVGTALFAEAASADKEPAAPDAAPSTEQRANAAGRQKNRRRRRSDDGRVSIIGDGAGRRP